MRIVYFKTFVGCCVTKDFGKPFNIRNFENCYSLNTAWYITYIGKSFCIVFSHFDLTHDTMIARC